MVQDAQQSRTALQGSDLRSRVVRLSLQHFPNSTANLGELEGVDQLTTLPHTSSDHPAGLEFQSFRGGERVDPGKRRLKEEWREDA